MLIPPHQTLQVKYKCPLQGLGSKVNADISEVRGRNVLWVEEAANHPGKEILVAGRCGRGRVTKNKYRIKCQVVMPVRKK